MSKEVAANLRLWDGWTDLHMSGTDYDVEEFIADPAARPFDWVTREVVGDVSGSGCCISHRTSGSTPCDSRLQVRIT